MDLSWISPLPTLVVGSSLITALTCYVLHHKITNYIDKISYTFIDISCYFFISSRNISVAFFFSFIFSVSGFFSVINKFVKNAFYLSWWVYWFSKAVLSPDAFWIPHIFWPLYENQHFRKNAQLKYHIFVNYRQWRKYHIFRKTKIKEIIIFSIISDIFCNKSTKQDYEKNEKKKKKWLEE